MEKYTLINENISTDLIAKSEIVEKKSKFISYIFKINFQDEAIAYIEQIKNENKDARHVVYIYSYIKDNIVNYRFSDDGEPKGTGTKAIYELLEKEGLTNICIVIVRYFGGILLGAGLLSRTYLNSARESILKCNRKKLYNYIERNFKVSYSKFKIIEQKINDFIKKEDISNIKINYSDVVDIKCYIKEEEEINIEKLFL